MAKQINAKPKHSSLVVKTGCYLSGVEGKAGAIPPAVSSWDEARQYIASYRFHIKGKDDADDERPKGCVHCVNSLLVLDVALTAFKLAGYLHSETHFGETHFAAYFVKYHQFSMDRKIIDYLKWKNSCVAAWAFGNPQPPRPEFVAKEDKGECAFHGGANGFVHVMKRRLESKKPDVVYKSLSFFNSLLMQKRGQPRPDEQALEEATVKAEQQLAKPCYYGHLIYDPDTGLTKELAFDLRLWRECPTHCERMKSLQERVSLVCKSLFRKVRKMTSEEWKEIPAGSPSLSSHIESKTSKGGAKGFLVPFLETIGNDRYKHEVVDAVDKFVVQKSKEWCKREVARRMQSGRLVSGEDESREDRVLVEESEVMKQRRVILQRLCVEEAKKVGAPAMVHALAEALKIRTITLGSVFLYTALIPVQKMLFNCLKDDKRFQIGGPITPEKVGWLLGKLAKGEKWLSGDYKAATDNLSAYLSTVAVDAIATEINMPDEYRQLFHMALTEHRIFQTKPKDGGKKGRDVVGELPQASGQLMGSPVSFPILCIVNFAVIWQAMCEVHGEIPFSQVKMIVNGDDCLFAANAEVKARWEELAARAGLSPSVGKTYWSEDIMVINSMLLSYRFAQDVLMREKDGALETQLIPAGSGSLADDSFEDYLAEAAGDKELFGDEGKAWDRPTPSVTRALPRGVMSLVFELAGWTLCPVAEHMPDLNFSLLDGVHRDGSRAEVNVVSGDEFAEDAGSRLRSLLRGFDTAAQCYLMAEFIRRNRNSFQKGEKNIVPYFLPKVLGGYGLPCIVSYGAAGVTDIDEWKQHETIHFGPSVEDRKKAAYIIDKCKFLRQVETDEEMRVKGKKTMTEQEKQDKVRDFLPPNLAEAISTEYCEAMKCARETFGSCRIPDGDRSDCVGGYTFFFMSSEERKAKEKKLAERLLNKFWARISRRPEVYSKDQRIATLEEIKNFCLPNWVPDVRVCRSENTPTFVAHDPEKPWENDEIRRLQRGGNEYSVRELVAPAERENALKNITKSIVYGANKAIVHLQLLASFD